MHWDITYLEFLSIASVKEVFKDQMHGYKSIIIESDNVNIIKFIHKAIKKGNKGVDKISLVDSFNFVIFNCVKRECNKLADLCANFGAFSSFFWDDIFLDKVHPSFVNILKESLACT
ncbi:hypothetical protein KFK09_001813 [Dendrobium nobile]|uniref:RNase H type-1 domain-containing protein n=1 Tax=Dendrobium nobile TaxID=94219 RepID=A0A8T3C5V1_DENNO|nr:hypothetical protein KFK09_001813 [Dendrobium nobile]